MYFTIYCVKAVKYDIKVLKLVQMPDHLHHAAIENDCGQLALFLQNVTATFVKEYNGAYGRKGSLFESPYGRAMKKTEKSIRTNLLYLDNNPVERFLVKQAEEYRWNYLAYAVSDHPFSENIILREASYGLRKALKMVRFLHKRGRYLKITTLNSLFRGLTDKEKAQMFEQGQSNVLSKLLPVIDNFERGLASVPEEEKDGAFADGMNKIYKQLVTELENLGVTPIEAVGKEFDPNLHNAVMQVQTDEFESGIVAQELQKGYKFHDTVLRHSMVGVTQ